MQSRKARHFAIALVRQNFPIDGDRIIGNRRDNILDGGSGNDTIMAHDGDDLITPRRRDKVQGGEGIDTKIYEEKLYRKSQSGIFSMVKADLLNGREL